MPKKHICVKCRARGKNTRSLAIERRYWNREGGLTEVQEGLTWFLLGKPERIRDNPLHCSDDAAVLTMTELCDMVHGHCRASDELAEEYGPDGSEATFPFLSVTLSERFPKLPKRCQDCVATIAGHIYAASEEYDPD